MAPPPGAPRGALGRGRSAASAAASCAAAVPAESIERMFVQVGAFSQPENAERLVARLRASGFANPDRRQRARRPARAAPRAVGADSRLRRVRPVERAPARDRRVGLAARRGPRAMSFAAQRLRARCAWRFALPSWQHCRRRRSAGRSRRAAESRLQEPLPRRLHDGQGARRRARADEQLPPASLTKLMTAYVVFGALESGRIRLDDRAHVSEKAWRMGGTRMFIEVNSEVGIEDLLRGLLDPVRQRRGRGARRARRGLRRRVRRRDERRGEGARHAELGVPQPARACRRAAITRRRTILPCWRRRSSTSFRISTVSTPSASSATTASRSTTATRSCGATRASTA